MLTETNYAALKKDRCYGGRGLAGWPSPTVRPAAGADVTVGASGVPDAFSKKDASQLLNVPRWRHRHCWGVRAWMAEQVSTPFTKGLNESSNAARQDRGMGCM